MSFGDKIKKLREQKGLSQNELGKLFGLTGPAIAQYEKNKRFPDQNMLVKFADYFEVSTDYLLGRSVIPDDATIAAHRPDGYDKDLPEDAQEELEQYIAFLRHKYKKDK